MKMKGLILAVLLIAIPICGFAYDGTLIGGFGGNLTRYSFIQQFSSIEFLRSDLRDVFGNNVRIEQMVQITENDVDEEDVQMINDHAAYIQRNFRVSDGDVYSYFVRRTTHAGNVWTDGWAVYSHYSASQGWLRYLYYFKVA